MPTVPKKFPAQLGRYKLLRLISRGGMAYVYEARRESMAGVSPRVAIKMIVPEKATDEAYKELFITEAKVSSNLMHRNLVHIQDFEEVDGSFFLVMEYVEGVTLRDSIRIARQHGLPIPVHVIAEVGRQICDGLHHAHQATTSEGRPLGLVHCDIKPSNVIVNQQGMVKVLDFGVSHASISTAKSSSLRGTWGYMAPEQLDRDLVTPRTDIFALAILLYEMAALRPMFSKQEKSDNKTMKKFLKGDEAARRASALSGGYNALILILVRALQRDPAGRYLSAEDMGEALSALVSDPVIARTDLNSFLVKVEELRKTGERNATISPADEQEDFSGRPVRITKPKVEQSDDKQKQFGLIFLLVAPLLLVVLLAGVLKFSCGSAREGTPQFTKQNNVEELSTQKETPMPRVEETKSQGDFDEQPAVKKPKKKAPKKPKKVEKKEPKIEAEVVTEEAVEVEEPEGEIRITPEVTAVDANARFGKITISADRNAVVFIDGKEVSKAPLIRYEIAAGEHRIHIARKATGQVKIFTVDIKGGSSSIYQWSFDDEKWLRNGK